MAKRPSSAHRPTDTRFPFPVFAPPHHRTGRLKEQTKTNTTSKGRWVLMLFFRNKVNDGLLVVVVVNDIQFQHLSTKTTILPKSCWYRVTENKFEREREETLRLLIRPLFIEM